LFRFLGARPRTSWLPPGIQTDVRGFVLTGRAVTRRAQRAGGREPFTLETSHPGVFAAGDVRHGSVKRVASAVGEGAMAIMFVHQYLSEP
jgi:thioredoxin reductase (NADPH)